MLHYARGKGRIIGEIQPSHFTAQIRSSLYYTEVECCQRLFRKVAFTEIAVKALYTRQKKSLRKVHICMKPQLKNQNCPFIYNLMAISGWTHGDPIIFCVCAIQDLRTYISPVCGSAFHYSSCFH